MVKGTKGARVEKQETSNKDASENILEEKILEILELIWSLSAAQNKLKYLGRNFQADFLCATENLIREYFNYWRDT